MKDPLGDRMKMYERAESGRRLMPLLPTVARIDGRSFHSFTRGMVRPFDHDFSASMVETTIALAKMTNAIIGYTQSDEITLVWHNTDYKSQIWFDGRIAKMTSQLAAQATLIFYRIIEEKMPEFASRLPTFDARVWNLPNRDEVINLLLWREADATRNSISMAAREYFSHKALMGKNSAEKQEMLFQAGINWNEYLTSFKRGVYVRRVTVETPFTTDELAKLPIKHAAHTNPNLTISRTMYTPCNLPQLSTILNKTAVIFNAEPVAYSKV